MNILCLKHLNVPNVHKHLNVPNVHNNFEVQMVSNIIVCSGDLSLALDMQEPASSTPTGTLDLTTVDDSVTQQESPSQVSEKSVVMFRM